MPLTVAFLRGINLGKRRIGMADLKSSFERAGFDRVKTVLASGNVLFEGDADSATAARVEAQIERDFGFFSETILRGIPELQAMQDADPFAGHIAGPDTKFYIFVLRDPETGKLALPCRAEGDFEVVKVTEREIFAVAWHMASGRFGEGLDRIGKPFGRHITNRNWNTVGRLLTAAKAMDGGQMPLS